MFKKIIILILSLSITAFIFYTIHALSSADRYYMQGLKFEKEEKYQDAYYNFGKINRFSKIYPLGVYKQAKCAKVLGDNKTAIKKYEKYISAVHNEIMTPVGLWELGNLYYETGKVQNAQKIFKKIEDKYPDNNYAYASYFRLGEILKEKNKEDVLSYFIKYLEYAPLGRFSKKALQYVEETNLPLSDEDKIILSNALSQNGEHDKALTYINSIPQDKKWIQEYKIYKNKNDEKRALDIVKNGLALENKDVKEKDLKEAVNWYISKKISKEDIKNLFNETNKKGNKAHIYIAIIYAQNFDNAYNLYLDILKSNSKYSDIALSEMIYLDYKNKNYKSAIRLCSDFNSKYKDKKTAPYALYYAGKSYEKLGDRKQTENIYKKIITEYTNDYYAYRAYQALKNKSSFNIILNGELPRNREIKYQFSMDDKESYLLNKLVQLNDISTVEDLKVQDEFLKSYLAYKNKRYGYSILLARNEAENIEKLNKTQAMLLYPLYYQGAINKYSKQNKISPHLIIALIRKESHFDTDAKSGAGAVGLMQVLPSTAYFIEKGNLKDDIKNTNYNIYVGTKYFSYLKKSFNNNDMLSVAAYNAGPGNVQKWIKNGIQDYDIFVEDIPFVETKSYIKRIFEGYWNYINLYK